MSAQADRYSKGTPPGRVRISAERQGMLAKVHLARKALRMEEDAYRDLLRRVTGVDSAARASDAALHRLLGEFRRLGWTAQSAQHSRRRANKAQVRMIHAVWAELAPYVDSHTDDALRAFVVRQTRSAMHPDGMAAPEFLGGHQANRVLEGLKAWLAREKSKTEPRGDRA